MALSFNIPSSPSSFYFTTIDQQGYTFSFNWQERVKCWHMDIVTAEGEVLARGSKLVVNSPIIRRNKQFAPNGNIYVIQNTLDSNEVPTRYNIGPDKDFELMFLTTEELNALVEAV